MTPSVKEGLRPVAEHIKRRPVLIVWEDSGGNGGWIHDSDLDLEPVHVWTLGWVLKETDESMVVSAFCADPGTRNSQSHGPLAVPRRAILDLAYLDE